MKANLYTTTSDRQHLKTKIQTLYSLFVIQQIDFFNNFESKSKYIYTSILGWRKNNSYFYFPSLI